MAKLKNAYSAQPFRPFTIHLADGREVPVLSREFIMTVPSGRTVVVCQPDDTLNIIAEHWPRSVAPGVGHTVFDAAA